MIYYDFYGTGRLIHNQNENNYGFEEIETLNWIYLQLFLSGFDKP